jgi:hypothetical protein
VPSHQVRRHGDLRLTVEKLGAYLHEHNFFAPAGRTYEQLLSKQHFSVSQSIFITAGLNSFTEMVLILNEQRQIIAANKPLLYAFGVADPLSLVGFYPGEATNCIHSNEGSDGCRKSGICSVCGAVMTILASQ